MMMTKSLKISHGFTDKFSIFSIPKIIGIEKGAMIEVVIVILTESAVFPLTMSAKAGNDTPAGMAVSNKTPSASS